MRQAAMAYGGGTLSYWVSEPPSGAAPILLLHGLGADHRGLLPLAAHLPGNPVVAVDLPGFGHSEPLVGAHTLDAYALAVEALCGHLGLSAITVVGHSLGASIGLAHAAVFPDRVAALAMLMPVTTGSGPGTWLPRAYYRVGSRLPARAARAWFLSRAAVFLSDVSTLRTREVSIRRSILRNDYRTAALASPRAIQEIYWSMRRSPFLELAARVRARALILGASHDALTPPGSLRRLHRRMQGSKLIVAPGVGHLWPVEQPEAVAALIVAALSLRA